MLAFVEHGQGHEVTIIGPKSAVAVVSEWSITDFILVKNLSKCQVFDKFGNLLRTN